MINRAKQPETWKTSMSRSRSTIRDVAREAGVSHQTVSRVINGSNDVLPKTRARVEQAIKALGFRPSAIARSMAQGRTNTLACIAPNLTDYTLASVIEGAEVEARKHGYFLLSSSANDLETFCALVDELVGRRRVDGLIVINPYIDERYTAVPTNFPVVFVGTQARDKSVCSVSLDDEKAAYDATQHLISLKYRKIAMVTGPMKEDCCHDRSNGYMRALDEAGIQVDLAMIIEGDWSATSGQDALLALAEQGCLPSAIFAQNDRMALGILHTAHDMGLRVPEQLAVIGVDDMPLASYFDPPLTTMHQDMPRIGQEAIRMLVNSIDKSIDDYTPIKLPAQLIEQCA
jgi:LacI family repressor for deo operon, udp, cdd, tsx, nupC, and nupG